MHLELQDLSVHYPGRSQAAVDAVNMDLAQGEVGVLVGPSGCGKTSLLRAVAGLEPVSGGRILINQRLVSDAHGHVPPEERRVGMVFQDFALFPHLSVHGNVAYGLNRLSSARQRERVNEVLALVGLSELIDRYPHQLSGGQQQRVALARALAPRPDLLLLDEPFSSLDVELRQRLAHDLRTILKSAGATALMVTHDQAEAFAMGDRVGVMRDGQLHQWSNPYDIYHKPATRFVADFIGHGVLMEATWQADLGARRVRSVLGEWMVSGPTPAGESGRCQILLRADDIVHDDDSPFQGRILSKQFRGADFLYVLALDSGHEVMSLVPSHHDHALGERIGIRVMPEHVVVFDDIPLG
jgi:iron(III) transport system ATP-binding protein